MMQAIALTAMVGVAGLLIAAARKPDIFQIRRSIFIHARPETVFPLIDDLRQVNLWNPYTLKDPDIQLTYRGPASGRGAAYDFAGNRHVGKGSFEITDTMPPNRLTMRLDMHEPFICRNTVEFILVPQGQGTQVTWSMHGPNTFISKVMSLFFSMDKMVGKDFEAGLEKLKSHAEKQR